MIIVIYLGKGSLRENILNIPHTKGHIIFSAKSRLTNENPFVSYGAYPVDNFRSLYNKANSFCMFQE